MRWDTPLSEFTVRAWVRCLRSQSLTFQNLWSRVDICGEESQLPLLELPNGRVALS